jgi:hypothetical protein
MTELTIETLIKIIVGVFVFVAVILGVYISMNTYIIPYFTGFGFGNMTSGTGSSGGISMSDLCDKNGIWGTIGAADKDNKGYRPILKSGSSTDYWLDGSKILVKGLASPAPGYLYNPVGSIINYRIKIGSTYKLRAGELDGKIVSGNNICNA